MIPRLPRTCKRQNEVLINNSIHSKIKGKLSTHKKNQLLQKSLEESYEIFKKTSQKISVTSTPVKQCYVKLLKCNLGNTPDKMSGRKKKNPITQAVLCGSKNENTQAASKLNINLRSRHSTSLEENSNNLKDKEITLPRLPRTCKRQNDHILKVNPSKHSKIKGKSSAHKNIQLSQKSQHMFEESYETFKKTSQKISATSTPTRQCHVKLVNINLENIPDTMSERKKKDPISQAVLFGSENENTQSASKLSINLRSRHSTPLEENSNNLKEKGTLQRQPRSCRPSVNNSTNSVSRKMRRKPLMCKKNITKQDKWEENLEESCFQNDDFSRTSQGIPVTSTPLVPYQRKTKKFKNLNLLKSTNTKRRGKTISDFPFEMPNRTVETSICDLIRTRRSASLQETRNNLGAQIMNDAKHTQKSSTNKKNGKQLIPKRHTISEEFPIDDLSLTKTVQNKRKVKSDGFKVPSKNTLKRKRYVFSEFQKANEGYEDDIYESQKFDCFKEIFEDTTFSDISSSMPTPKFGCSVTPRIFPKTPLFKDCISPTEYARTRKVAEECLYRNKKKKNTSREETADVPEKKKLEFNEALGNIQMQEKMLEKLMEEERSDTEDSSLSD